MSALTAAAWEHAAADGRTAADPPATDALGRRGPARAATPVPLRPQLSHTTRWGAFAAAVLIQSGMAVALLLGLSPRLVRHETQVLQVAIEPPAVKPPPKAPPLHPVLIKDHAVEVMTVPELHLAQMAPVVSMVPSPMARSVPVRHLAPPPSVPVVAKVAMSFEQQMLAAVQASVDGHYPAAARLLHQQGQADVGFDYLDGQVSHIWLVQSSGSGVLDRAALATVRDARYPTPPAKLLHQPEHYEVWVRFRLDRG